MSFPGKGLVSGDCRSRSHLALWPSGARTPGDRRAEGGWGPPPPCGSRAGLRGPSRPRPPAGLGAAPAAGLSCLGFPWLGLAAPGVRCRTRGWGFFTEGAGLASPPPTPGMPAMSPGPAAAGRTLVSEGEPGGGGPDQVLGSSGLGCRVKGIRPPGARPRLRGHPAAPMNEKHETPERRGLVCVDRLLIFPHLLLTSLRLAEICFY